jgi:hypothetical protein
MAKKKKSELVKFVEMAKRNGIPREVLERCCREATESLARFEGWRQSELAVARASEKRVIGEVYGQVEEKGGAR